MKDQIRQEMDQIAPDRSRLIRNNSYYYERLLKFLTLNIPEGKSIIEIGCGNGYLFRHLKPSRAVGIDFSPVMIKCAKEQNPEFEFYVMDAEEIEIDEKFDFVIISDTIGYFEDVQKALENVKTVCHSETRITQRQNKKQKARCLLATEFEQTLKLN